MVEIYENYREYVPPKWVRPAVERLVGSLGPEHTAHLDSIVLTNAACLPKGKTNRVKGRKYTNQECRGFYHHAQGGRRAWIEIAVDNTLKPFSHRTLPLNVLRDLVIGQVLYHEIGHHLHETLGSAQAVGRRRPMIGAYGSTTCTSGNATGF